MSFIMKTNPKISVVSPVYKASGMLLELVDELKLAFESLNVTYEIILVNDASPDNSWEIIQEMSKKDSKIIGIQLSRNFGQHPAILAGLSKAIGEWVVVMDCDLQDQPKEIAKLYQKAQEGFDVVLAKRIERKDSYFKKMTSKVFYKVFNFLAGVQMNSEISNFGIYKRKVIDSILLMGDGTIFFPLFVKWVGFKQTAIEIKHSKRNEGTSSYSFFKLLQLSFNTIISFSDKPLKLFLGFGITISLLSFIGAVMVLIKALLGDIEVIGYSSIFICICLFSGIIITILGVIGIYLGKMYDQVKNRPTYIINNDENQ